MKIKETLTLIFETKTVSLSLFFMMLICYFFIGVFWSAKYYQIEAHNYIEETFDSLANPTSKIYENNPSYWNPLLKEINKTNITLFENDTVFSPLNYEKYKKRFNNK